MTEIHKQMPSFPPPDFAHRALKRLRDRKRELVMAGLLALVIAGTAGGGFYYRHHKEEKGAALYALLPLKGEKREKGLRDIAEGYPRTGAGIRARFVLGRTAFESGDYDGALEWYKPLLKLPGRRSLFRIMAYHNVGAVYEAKGEWKNALDIYNLAAADPDNKTVAYTYYHLGRVYHAIGNKEKSREWFEKAKEKGVGLEVSKRAEERLQWLKLQK